MTTKSSVRDRSSGSLRDDRRHEHHPRDHLSVSCSLNPGAAELNAAFTLNAAEFRFVRRQSRQEATAALIMVQLKLLQRLGYFPMLVDVPPIIIDHIRTAMRARTLSRTAIARYHVSGSRIRHNPLADRKNH